VPALIHVVSKPGRAQAINASYRAEVENGFLIWTRDRIAAHIRAVNAGQVEALIHLRGQLGSIADWNRELPEMAEGCGSVLIGDHEATLTPLLLVSLRKSVIFIEKHREEFKSIEGMEFAQMLLGGPGRAGIGVVAPGKPKSMIYVLCVRYKKLDLWTKVYKFRCDPSRHTWAGLKSQTVPWLCDRTVESLVKVIPSYSAGEEFPSAITLRRALLPSNLPPAAQTALGDHVVKLPPRGRR
jgi:hypothetical protein